MMDLLSSKLEFDVNGVSTEFRLSRIGDSPATERLLVGRCERNIRNDYISFN